MQQLPPEQRQRLTQRYEEFQRFLQKNATVA